MPHLRSLALWLLSSGCLLCGISRAFHISSSENNGVKQIERRKLLQQSIVFSSMIAPVALPPPCRATEPQIAKSPNIYEIEDTDIQPWLKPSVRLRVASWGPIQPVTWKKNSSTPFGLPAPPIHADSRLHAWHTAIHAYKETRAEQSRCSRVLCVEIVPL